MRNISMDKKNDFSTIGTRKMLIFGLMWRAAFAKWWEPQKFYYTKVFQELYVGLAVTGYIFYKISYGGKKKVADKPAAAHH
uniref:Uncharacterized protein n=1 Tax=Sphaerodactylus townsendi TaxID=933632 RepID=A0ACB8G5X2_9SAUR